VDQEHHGAVSRGLAQDAKSVDGGPRARKIGVQVRYVPTEVFDFVERCKVRA
jgi:hypothetical protein